MPLLQVSLFQPVTHPAIHFIGKSVCNLLSHLIDQPVMICQSISESIRLSVS